MPTALAAHAFGHALAVLGREGPAVEAALTALRRGGRSRVAVLAHARHQALAAVSAGEAGDALAGAEAGRDEPLAASDLTSVARALASTRPPIERAIADLDGRHGLDRAGLGRAMGLSPADAAARAAAVAHVWERELDPALLVWLGPGDCRDLAVLLSDRGLAPPPAPEDGGEDGVPAEEPDPVDPPSLAAAVEVAPAIAAHVEGCEVCRDRRRAMVSVRSLLTQEPLGPAPEAVRIAAAKARKRRPGPPPPPLEPGESRRMPRWAWAAAAVALAVGGAATAAALTSSGDQGPAGDDRVAQLTQVRESGSALVVTPEALDPSTDELRIVNTSGREITWRLSTDADWLDALPAQGRLAAGASTRVSVRLRDKAPEGDLRASITVSGDDGSTAGATYAGTFERPPEVSASREDCLAAAVIEDDGHVNAVTLHWEGGVTGQRSMVQRGDAWVGALPSEDAAITWYVEATDDRGNTARSPSHELPAATC